MTSGPPYRQKIVPRTYVCKKTGKSCAYEKCPEHESYSKYIRCFDTCPHRELSTNEASLRKVKE